MRRLGLILGACVMGLALAFASAWIGDVWQRATYRAPAGTRLAKPCVADNICDHVVDEARAIPIGEIGRVNHYVAQMLAESDVDVRLLLRRGGAGLDATGGVAAMEALRVGSTTREQRGVLLQFDMDERRLRMDVGYGLEGYFPDAFVAYLLDQHSRLFFETQQPLVALQMLLRLLHHRIREAILGGEFDPRFLTLLSDAPPLSGGAGATRSAQAGVEVASAAPAGEVDLTYRAAASPAQTFSQYLRLLAGPEQLADSDLFTAASRAYLRRTPLSPAYRHFILMLEYGKAFQIVERADHAILYFTGTPFASPHFFVREEGGWRMDIGAELNATTEHVGGVYTWSIKTMDEPAIARFRELVVVVDGHARIQGGDNQPLPRRTAAAGGAARGRR